MANVLVEESSLQAIADAIRYKTGGSDTYKPREMAPAIRNLPDGAELQSLSVTENGNYTPPSGVDGFDFVSVAVPGGFGAGDEGKVIVNGALMPQTSLSVTANGTYDTTSHNRVMVNVPNCWNPVNLFHPRLYSGSSYNTPDPGLIITRADDDTGTVCFNGTKNINGTVNYQFSVPDEVVKALAGCTICSVSDDTRVIAAIQKRVSPYTRYLTLYHGQNGTIPQINDTDIVFWIGVSEAGAYDNVTGYLRILGIQAE